MLPKLYSFMKYLVLQAIIVLSIAGCGPQSKTETKAEQQSVDSTYFFIRTILNGSPKEVVKWLGPPDQPIKTTTDCYLDDGPCQIASYQHELYFVQYNNDKLKYLECVAFPSFDHTTIQLLGFPKWEPTWESKQMLAWRTPSPKFTKSTGPFIPISGIIEISVFRSDKGSLLHVEVEASHDSKF